MSGLNKAIIVGNVGRDPEKRAVGADSVVNFSVATSEKYNGNEKTEWHRIVAWGKLADVVSQYVRKGSMVAVEGKIQTREWEKDGQKRQQTEIVASSVTFLGKPPERGGRAADDESRL